MFIYIKKATPEGDKQIHAGINTLESDRHEIVACIARASIGNRVLGPKATLGFKRDDVNGMMFLVW